MTGSETVLGVGRDAEGELGDGYADPATQVSAAGDRNGQGAPASGDGSAKDVLTTVTGLAQVRPQAPVNATYTYTGDGLRGSATTTVDDATTVVPATTRSTFTWDTTTTIPTLLCDGTHDYINGPAGLIEQTGVLATSNPAAADTVFVHADRIGSTRLLTNTAGQPVATFDYTPTGQTMQADGLNLLPYAQGIPPAQATTPIGYAGAYTDPGTGWQYLQARYNDPTTDQFISVDPAVAVTGQPYSYAGDDPVNNTDPTGLDWLNDVSDWSAGFGDAVTFGGTKQIRRLINYGTTGCTSDLSSVDHNSIFYKFGGYGGEVASLVPTGGGLAWAGRLSKASGLADALGKRAFVNPVIGVGSRLFGNNTLAGIGRSGLLNPAGKGPWRLGWSVNGRLGGAARWGFRLKSPLLKNYAWLFYGPPR